jgi:hypothetical protein
MGEAPPVKDLDTAPWRNNLSLLPSAKVRAAPTEDKLKWTQVVNEQGIREARDAAGIDTPPLSKAVRDGLAARKKAAKEARKADQATVKQAKGKPQDEGQDDDEEQDEEQEEEEEKEEKKQPRKRKEATKKGGR